MSEYTADEQLIGPRIKLLSEVVTALVGNEVTVPATSSKGNSTARDNEGSASTTSQAMTRSYCHVLSVSEIIGLAKRLDIHDVVGQDKVDSVKNREGAQQDDNDTTTPADIDMLACAQDANSSALDTETIFCQQNDDDGTFQSTSTKETSTQQNLSNHSTKSLTTSPPLNPTMRLLQAPTQFQWSIQHGAQNIFNKRAPQRNVRWRPELDNPETTHATEDDEKDGDGLTEEELRELQSEREAQMEQKTERFLRMVSQYSWLPRVVEDLGEIFEIED